MKLWINWFAATLLAMMPMVLHLIWKKPKTENSTYDLAGLIVDPPSSEPKDPVKSFATIHSIDEVELPIQAIRDCLTRSRELSRPYAAKMKMGLSLEKSAKESVGLSADTALAALKTDNSEETRASKHETITETEEENVVRPNDTQNIAPSPSDYGRRSSHRHVRNVDAALEIRSRQP